MKTLPGTWGEGFKIGALVISGMYERSPGITHAEVRKLVHDLLGEDTPEAMDKKTSNGRIYRLSPEGRIMKSEKMKEYWKRRNKEKTA